MTLLVEKLLESQELRALGEIPLDPKERARLEKRRVDCEKIIHYLMDRFASLNERFSRDAARQSTEETALVDDEIRMMDDAVLLRYGNVLKYICCAEADLQHMPLEECQAKFREAQCEWQKRFGNTVLKESF